MVRLLKLTNANTGQDVYVNAFQIAGYYYSAKDKCTHVITVGAIMPVTESVEELTKVLTEPKAVNTGPESVSQQEA